MVRYRTKRPAGLLLATPRAENGAPAGEGSNGLPVSDLGSGYVFVPVPGG
ncbi:hypothetical protein [Kitasatospora sp. NPDC088346]